eukprot:g13676.t1
MDNLQLEFNSSALAQRQYPLQVVSDTGGGGNHRLTDLGRFLLSVYGQQSGFLLLGNQDHGAPMCSSIHSITSMLQNASPKTIVDSRLEKSRILMCWNFCLNFLCSLASPSAHCFFVAKGLHVQTINNLSFWDACRNHLKQECESVSVGKVCGLGMHIFQDRA